MIGFSIEFKKWYFVIRGPMHRVRFMCGFAKEMPVIGPYVSYTIQELPFEEIEGNRDNEKADSIITHKLL